MQEKILKLGIRTGPLNQNEEAPADLHSAAKWGHVESILGLLQAGVQVDEKSASGWTALQVASAQNQPSVARMLLEHGADTSIRYERGATALHMAAVNGHAEVVDVLMRHGASLVDTMGDNKHTAIHLAALRGRRDVLKTLNGHDANLEERTDNGNTALHLACEQGHIDCVQELLLGGANIEAVAEIGETPLIVAAFHGQDSVVRALLEFGANVDAQQDFGRTATMVAAYKGQLKVLQILISAGANLDVMDKEGFTALRCAIQWNHPEAALLLLKHRIRVNEIYTDHLDTALHFAIRHDQPAVVKALLKRGADIEACDKDGDPPLQWAVQRGCEKLVKILLRYGAQVNKRNAATGDVVLHWAIRCGHVALTEILLAYGSDPSLIDLSAISKEKDVDDEGFETCKILAETALSAGDFSDIEAPRSMSASPTIIDQIEVVSEHSTEQKDEEAVSSNLITNPIYNIPEQSAADTFLVEYQNEVEHKGVKCDGPHCTQMSSPLRGIRFKCSWCENVDLCLTCIQSFYNKHDHRHPVIQCLLPTNCQIIREADENTKRACIQQSALEGSLDIKDVSHMVYAETDKQGLQQLQNDLKGREDLNYSGSEILTQDTTPTIFAIFKSHLTQINYRQSRIIEQNPDEPGSLAMYQIEETGNARVQYVPLGKSVEIKEERIMHHQEPNLLLNAVMGKVVPFDYSRDKTLDDWAWEGRLATRIIHVKPGTFSDKIEIELETVDLLQNPSYEALSYTWKETAYERAHISSWSKENDEHLRNTGKHLHTVYCRSDADKEEFLTVSCGLRDALRRLRHPSNTKTFWIDQLSINQQSYNERAFQVARMMFCYNRARQVTVWTGDEEEHTQDAFQFCKKVTRACRELGILPTPEEIANYLGETLPLPEDKTWKAVLDFFQRPVFGRSWVIQEIVVGTKVVVRCGSHEMDWADLSTTINLLSTRAWLKYTSVEDQLLKFNFTRKLGQQSATDVERRAEYTGPFGNVTIIHGLRTDYQTCHENTLENLLYITGGFEATDPRDKIYAVLGVRSAQFPPGSQEDFVPDYKKSVLEVFTDATKLCIQKSSSMNICGLNDSLSSKHISGLPSWVPDFTTTAHSGFFPYSRPLPANPYNASEGVPLIAEWLYKDRPDLLVGSSCKIDTITAVSERYWYVREEIPATLIEWSKMASINPYYPTGEFAADIFVKTCISDCHGTQRRSPATTSFILSVGLIMSKYFMSCFADETSQSGRDGPPETLNRMMATIIQISEESFPGILFQDDAATTAIATTSPPEAELEVGTGPSEALFLACHNRKFFVTNNNFFGLGPRDMGVGDEIHVLSGTRVPFVMRKADNVDDQRTREMVEADGLSLYRMIGETFVHGFMHGEIAGRTDENWEGICVC